MLKIRFFLCHILSSSCTGCPRVLKKRSYISQLLSRAHLDFFHFSDRAARIEPILKPLDLKTIGTFFFLILSSIFLLCYWHIVKKSSEGLKWIFRKACTLMHYESLFYGLIFSMHKLKGDPVNIM